MGDPIDIQGVQRVDSLIHKGTCSSSAGVPDGGNDDAASCASTASVSSSSASSTPSATDRRRGCRKSNTGEVPGSPQQHCKVERCDTWLAPSPVASPKHGAAMAPAHSLMHLAKGSSLCSEEALIARLRIPKTLSVSSTESSRMDRFRISNSLTLKRNIRSPPVAFRDTKTHNMLTFEGLCGAAGGMQYIVNGSLRPTIYYMRYDDKTGLLRYPELDKGCNLPRISPFASSNQRILSGLKRAAVESGTRFDLPPPEEMPVLLCLVNNPSKTLMDYNSINLFVARGGGKKHLKLVVGSWPHDPLAPPPAEGPGRTSGMFDVVRVGYNVFEHIFTFWDSDCQRGGKQVCRGYESAGCPASRVRALCSAGGAEFVFTHGDPDSETLFIPLFTGLTAAFTPLGSRPGGPLYRLEPEAAPLGNGSTVGSAKNLVSPHHSTDSDSDGESPFRNGIPTPRGNANGNGNSDALPHGALRSRFGRLFRKKGGGGGGGVNSGGGVTPRGDPEGGSDPAGATVSRSDSGYDSNSLCGTLRDAHKRDGGRFSASAAWEEEYFFAGAGEATGAKITASAAKPAKLFLSTTASADPRLEKRQLALTLIYDNNLLACAGTHPCPTPADAPPADDAEAEGRSGADPESPSRSAAPSAAETYLPSTNPSRAAWRAKLIDSLAQIVRSQQAAASGRRSHLKDAAEKVGAALQRGDGQSSVSMVVKGLQLRRDSGVLDVRVAVRGAPTPQAAAPTQPTPPPPPSEGRGSSRRQHPHHPRSASKGFPADTASVASSASPPTSPRQKLVSNSTATTTSTGGNPCVAAAAAEAPPHSPVGVLRGGTGGGGGGQVGSPLSISSASSQQCHALPVPSMPSVTNGSSSWAATPSGSHTASFGERGGDGLSNSTGGSSSVSLLALSLPYEDYRRFDGVTYPAGRGGPALPLSATAEPASSVLQHSVVKSLYRACVVGGVDGSSVLSSLSPFTHTLKLMQLKKGLKEELVREIASWCRESAGDVSVHVVLWGFSEHGVPESRHVKLSGQWRDTLPKDVHLALASDEAWLESRGWTQGNILQGQAVYYRGVLASGAFFPVALCPAKPLLAQGFLPGSGDALHVVNTSAHDVLAHFRASAPGQRRNNGGKLNALPSGGIPNGKSTATVDDIFRKVAGQKDCVVQ